MGTGSQNDRLDAIVSFLGHEGDLEDANKRALQDALRVQGYTENFKHHGKPDGIIGRHTSRDIVDLLKDHPDMIPALSQSMRKHLINRGFAGELADIVRNNPSVAEQLKNQLLEVFPDAENLQKLDKKSLEIAQASWSMLGFYPADKKVDGVIGSGTQAAHTAYMGGEGVLKIPEPVIESAQQIAMSQPKIDLSEIFASHNAPQADFKHNGYGVPLGLIEKSWATVKTGESPVTQGKMIQIAHTEQRPLVVIDPGHGAGRDKGAHAHGLHETKAVDPVAKSLAEKLYRQGFDVAFTRNPDEKLPYKEGKGEPSSLQARSVFAHQLAKEMGNPNTYFISLHANSSADNAKGSIVFSGSQPDNDGKVTFGGAALNGSSSALSESIAKNMGAKTKTADAVVLSDFDTRAQGVPGQRAAVLIELAFLTNKKDAQNLAENPDTFADNIAKGIQNYHASVSSQAAPVLIAGNLNPQTQKLN